MRRIAWQSSVVWGLICILIGLSLAIAYAITITIAGLVFIASSQPSATIAIAQGKALETLQWLIAGLSTIFALGIRGIINPPGSGGLPTAKPPNEPATIGLCSTGHFPSLAKPASGLKIQES
jgi:hypothetical protein